MTTEELTDPRKPPLFVSRFARTYRVLATAKGSRRQKVL